MIIKEETQPNGVVVYTVGKDMSDEKVEQLVSKKLKRFKSIIDHDADVYTEDGALLLRFRKNVLPQKHVDMAYENMISYAKLKTATRGIASGSEVKDVGTNTKIMSNVMGYFDNLSIQDKLIYKTLKMKPKYGIRITRFTRAYPEKWQNIIPLVQDIDRMYKKLAPKYYKLQKAHADETAFKIGNTCFSTLTTNLNLQTACHRDSGNLKGTMGNLVVIQKGEYEGGYTGFPQYGVGVNVRSGDFLLMNVHEIHGNTPLKLKSEDAERLSIVSYLREGVYKNTRGSTPDDVKALEAKSERLLQRYRKALASVKQSHASRSSAP